MANYSLCVTAVAGASPRFLIQAFSGTPSQPITVSGIYCEGYSDSGCATNLGNMSYVSPGISFFPNPSFPTTLFPTSSPSPITWTNVNYIRIINIVINGVTYGLDGTYTIGSDTVDLNLAYCQPSGSFPCISISPTPTPTPSITPTNTPTNTPTSTMTPTPSTTPIICGSGVTTGTHYYTDCCGDFFTGSAVGTVVSFDYTKPFAGINKLQVAASVSCATPTPTPTNTMTSTPTLTPTNTSTPTSTPPPTPSVTPSNTPSPVYKLQNNCDVFTVFPLGATCVTIAQPTTSTSTDGILSLNITGGTTPYTVFWYKGSEFIGNGKTLFNKNQGSYKAVVTDFYQDFTATTFCTLIPPTPSPTPTNTATPTPTPTPSWPDLCLYIISSQQVFTPIQFVPTPNVNGKPTWTSGTYVISWDSNLNRWQISNLSVLGGQLVSTDTSNVPLASWTVAGIQGSVQPNIIMQEGTCSSTLPFNIQIQKQDNSCSGQTFNTGSITITANGGTPPYQYSINGGGSFQLSNIFTGLAAGTYQVVSKDFNGVTLNNSVVISNSQSITTYTISVQNTQTTVITPQNTRSYWKVNVTPAIPIGTTINFNLNIDSYQYINGPGQGTISSINVVSKNLISQPVTSQSTSTPVVTTRPNCSPYQLTSTTINQNYSLSMTAGDVISGTSTSALYISTPVVDSSNGCATTLEQDINVFVDQPITQGCTCCNVVADSQSLGGVTDHILQATQAEQTPSYFSVVLGFGNSEGSACNDFTYGITRFCNCPIISTGCFVYSGSPINPQVVLGQTFLTDSTTQVWELNPSTGQIIGPLLSPGGLPIFC